MLSSLLVSATMLLGQAPAMTSAPDLGAYSSPRLPVSATTAPGIGFGALVAANPARVVTTSGLAAQAGNGAPDTKNGASEEPKNGNKDQESTPGFLRNFVKAYKDEFFPRKNGEPEEDSPPTPRRALPEPWSSPPFPGSEYQGYPLIGVPTSSRVDPFMKGIYATPWGDAIKDTRIKFDGWVTTSGNWSTARNTNTPTSYWIVPNRYELDQLILRFQREVDTVQTDHMDWGFRSSNLYGLDYRYTTAGGWFSRQLLKNNLLYGWDPAEEYFDLYIPWIGQGTVIRVGRWIACPDIETQWAPDNYLGSHSILFTFDTYTQTGVMWTQRINEQLTVQGAIHAGTDMAPWYPGALPTGAFGVRWVTQDNNDSFYTWLNAINNAEFRHFTQYGQPLGHDNFNYVVTTWEHRFSKDIHTKTEAYYMWQRDAELGGTPSAGPLKSFGGGGGDGVLLPGLSQAYGVLNYTMFALSKNDYFTVRNEVWRDERGMRSGFPGTYTSHTIGISHNFNSVFQVRPEIGYYRNWNNQAFDGGNTKGLWLYGFDMTLRF